MSELDLIIIEQNRIVGAYPVTLQPTPHRIRVHSHELYAMCAVDSLSVAPLFHCDVEIHSRCHTSGDPIHIQMVDEQITLADPDAPRVGIRWQQPSQHAAHSLCTEMVFFRDQVCAEQWREKSVADISLFNLSDAATLGGAFFRPLLEP